MKSTLVSLTSLNFPDKIEMKTNVENFQKIPLLQFNKINDDEKEFKRNNSKLKLKLNKNNKNIQNLQNKLKQMKNIK